MAEARCGGRWCNLLDDEWWRPKGGQCRYGFSYQFISGEVEDASVSFRSCITPPLHDVALLLVPSTSPKIFGGNSVPPHPIPSSSATCNRQIHFCGLTFQFNVNQMLSIFMIPSKEAGYRKWWNIWHHALGYAVIGMFILYSKLICRDQQ